MFLELVSTGFDILLGFGFIKAFYSSFAPLFL